MAINLGVITINGVLAISCDTDPSISGGLVAPVGSFASAKDGSGFYYKNTVSNTGWSLASGATSVNGTTVIDFGSEQDRATSTITVAINPLVASVTNANINLSNAGYTNINIFRGVNGIKPDEVEEALNILETLVRSGIISVVVVDSVAALTPRAEIEGEMGAQFIGLQARIK